MEHQAVNTPYAPRAIGPYSQAIVAPLGLTIYCSGQVALCPETMVMKNADLNEEVHTVMSNLRAVLGAAGASFSDVVRCTIFLTDLNDFDSVNEIYAKHFEGVPPSRACVEVRRLPKDARVEIDAVAVIAGRAA